MKINFLSRLRLWQKFALLGALGLAAVAVPYVQYVRASQKSIDFAQTELRGIEPTQKSLRLLQLVQQHDALVTLAAGTEVQSNLRAAKQAEVDQLVVSLDKDIALIDAKPVKDAWEAVKQEWKQATTSSGNRTPDTRKNVEAHAVLGKGIQQFLDVLGDYYLLTLDPTSHTYFLVQVALEAMPELAENLAEIQLFGTSRLAEFTRLRTGGNDGSSALTALDRGAIVTLSASALESSEKVHRFIAKAVEAEPRLRTVLTPEAGPAQESVRQLVQLARKEIVDTPAPSQEPGRFLEAYNDGVAIQFKFMKLTSDTLRSELERYSDDLRYQRWVLSGQILAALAAVAVLAILTVRNITGTVAELQSSVEKVRQGDFDALAAIESRDEVGDLGRTVNGLLQERITAQRKAEDEKETLNNSVISILEAVNQLSQRDLTARAPVTQDIIGTVSDSINALTDETSKVLLGVSRIAGSVAESSSKVKGQADLVSKTAEEERKNVGTVIESLTDANVTMNQVAELAEKSNLSAERATQATDTALETVNGTVKGMESIRETIAETEKRIKRLGERSQEITGIVSLINTISERTHVLALNASMQAAVAGEAGRGFAVVAEEVQRLAESSRNATQQIGTLVSNIQLETNETIATVNRTIGQVVIGSEQAQKAGDQMRLTQAITGELVGQVRLIASSSERQRAASVQLLRSVEQIGQSNERTAQQMATQNAETETLLDSARRLVESVNVFKLPVVNT